MRQNGDVEREDKFRVLSLFEEIEVKAKHWVPALLETRHEQEIRVF